MKENHNGHSNATENGSQETGVNTSTGGESLGFPIHDAHQVGAGDAVSQRSGVTKDSGDPQNIGITIEKDHPEDARYWSEFAQEIRDECLTGYFKEIGVTEDHWVRALVKHKILFPGQSFADFGKKDAITQFAAKQRDVLSSVFRFRDTGYTFIWSPFEAEFLALFEKLKRLGMSPDVAGAEASALLRSRQTNPDRAVWDKPADPSKRKEIKRPRVDCRKAILNALVTFTNGAKASEVQASIAANYGITKSRFYQVWNDLKFEKKIQPICGFWFNAEGV